MGLLMVALTAAQLFMSAPRFIEEFLWIRNKHDQQVPFRLNPVQKKILRIKREAISAGRPRRFIELKARQQGVTTLEQALNFWTVCTKPNSRVVTLAHDFEASEEIFRIANLFYELMPEGIRPKRLTEHSKRTLDFPFMKSLFSIGTAGKKSFGRGKTLTKFHWSEMAFSSGGPNDQRKLLASLTQATAGGEGDLESTANGIGNLFHATYQEAKDGKNDWTPIFIAWWEDPNYRIRLDRELTAEVISTLSDEEKDLVARKGLSPEQIAWRRDKKRELKHLFEQEYPEDDSTCFLVSGSCYFDKLLLAAMLRRAPDPIEIRGSEEELRIWEKPIPGHRYAGGGDVAEGVPGGNHSVLGIIDCETMHPVACLRGLWKPEDFGERCAKLGREYNNAILAIERNNHGHSTLNTLVNVIHYEPLYYHRDYDQRSGKTVLALGFPTNSKTRPLMLSTLRTSIEDGLMPMPDKVFLSEAMTFIKVGEKYEAEDGCEDDTVIAWSIALMARQASLEEVGEVPSDFDPSRIAPRIFQSPEGRFF